MEQRVKACRALRGEVIPPGDKSISHRAVIFNGISDGVARITNFSPSADCSSTIDCLTALGVEIEVSSDVIVSGVGKRGLSEAKDVLNAGNSGTTMRLLTGLLSAQPFLSIITGDESLRSRPMGRIIQPLRLMGAQIWGRGGNSLAPLVIRGSQLHGIEYRLPVASAQVKTAIMLAALFAKGDTIIEEPAPSRDHTERLLRAMGAEVEVHPPQISVRPISAPLSAINLHIPGDISAAAFWLVAGAIHGDAQIKIPGCGINPTRSGIIDVLRAMGASLKIENQRTEGNEPVADLYIESSTLVGTQIGGDLIPRLIDEIPIIAVAASMAKGATVVRDASELRVKETDRISTTVTQLLKLGAEIQELPDGMIIRGGKRLRGAECDSGNDHRLAMALGVVALIAEGETIIHNAEAVNISYPGFWRDLERLSAY